ncbi:MAG: helix-turn-helix domain-containing protein [Promethearchaeota archaeon]
MNKFEWTGIKKALYIFLINYGKPMQRKEIVKQLNIPRTTIYENLEKLEKARLIKREQINNHKRGRPITVWSVRQK